MCEPLEPPLTAKSVNGSFKTWKVWNGKPYSGVNSALAIVSKITFISAFMIGSVTVLARLPTSGYNLFRLIRYMPSPELQQRAKVQ